MKRVATSKLVKVAKQAGIFAFIIFAITTAYANPVLDNVASGNVTVQQSPGVTQVIQSSQSAIINWNSFNIGANEATHFQQPTNGIALNRINPNQGASQIFGQLTATGQIILVNQAGLFFGSGAQVNVGGIIATTSDITNQNFLAGNYIFNQPSSISGAAIVNEGSIVAAQYGLVALLGSNVRNDGLMQAQLGNIVMASGSQFTVSFANDSLINFAVDAPVTNQTDGVVTNTGTLIANGGNILMTARAAQGVLDNVINMSGIAQANSVNEQNGEIILDGGDTGYVNVAGVLEASGLSVGQTGGVVKILGENITLQAPTVVNVNGDAGGGEILVGGNFHGAGPEQNAATTSIDSGVVLSANAITTGNGGQVAVWSNDNTQFQGTILAEGGAQSGNGGYVETSSENLLNMNGGAVNTLAANGTTGTWLLDPADVTIESNAGTDSNESYSNGVYGPTTGASTSIIDVTNLITALNSSNVDVTTSSTGTGNGDITVAASIPSASWTSGKTLTLSAYRDITINSGVTISNTKGGSLILKANNAGAFPVYSALGTLNGSGHGIVTNNGTIAVNGGLTVYTNPTSDYTSPPSYTNTSGSSTTYMLVSNVFDLQEISTNLNGNYALSTNIDASVTSTWNSGAGFTPLAYTSDFSGNFNGQNYSIDGLYIYLPNSPANVSHGVGLFGTSSGNITNVTLDNVNVTGNQNVAGLIGYMGNGTDTNDTVTGTVTGSYQSGGLVGYAYAGTLANSLADVIVNLSSGNSAGGAIGLIDNAFTVNNVTSHGYVVALSPQGGSGIGGLIGNVIGNGTLIENSFSDASIITESASGVGGLVGSINGQSTVQNSGFAGSISGSVNSSDTGGLVGDLLYGAVITNSYSNATVQGGSNVGGLVGSMYSNTGLPSPGITGSYSEGTVNGSTNVGGLVGYINTGAITYSYSGANVTVVPNIEGLAAGPGGGLIGYIDTGPASTYTNVSASYSSGAVTGSNTAGFIGGFNAGASITLVDNYWDMGTSGKATDNDPGTGGVTGLTTAEALQSSSYNGWTFGTTPASAAWYEEDGYTRPILQSEYSTTITTAHQLQLINLDPTASYQLAGNVDASGTSNAGDVWATSVGSGTGFDPIARGSSFTGSFNGNGYVINNVYMAPTDAVNTSYGLFSVLGTGGSISNVGIMNGTLTSSVGVPAELGLLVGSNTGGTITNVFATGNVSYTSTSGAAIVGGLLGIDSSGNTLSNSYSSVNVTNDSTDAGSLTGSFIGELSNLGTIQFSYSTGSVSAVAGYAGGFAGENNLSFIAEVYSTGAVPTSGATAGGLVGLEATQSNGRNFNGQTTISFWDTDTSGTNTGIGAFSPSEGFDSITGLTTAESLTTTTTPYTNYGWDISSTSLGHTWYMAACSGANCMSRPILESEYSTTINTAHQLELMNLNLAATYTLTGNVDASNTAAANTTDVWAGNTFSPVGSLSSPFTGSLNGQFYSINNLNISSSLKQVGLFAVAGDGTSSTGSIANLIMNNPTIINTDPTGGNQDFVGSVAGVVDSFNNYEVTMDNVSVIGGSVSASSGAAAFEYLGGVVGDYGDTFSGGLVENVSNNATVSTASGTTEAGGIAAEADSATFMNVSNSGEVLGNGGYVGGLVGHLVRSSMLSSYNVGLVENSSQGGGTGGLVGALDSSTIADSYNEGSVLSPQPFSADYVGGLVGWMVGTPTSNPISNSYNLGSVVTNSSTDIVGGLVGFVETMAPSITINNTFNAGYVSSPGTAGQLIGEINSGVTVTSINNFYDSDTSGSGNGGAVFGTAQTTAQLQNSTGPAYTAFSSTSPSTWGIDSSAGESYPYLLAMNPAGAPIIVSGKMPVTGNNAVAISQNGSQLATMTTPYYLTSIGTTQTGNNGYFYLQENPDAIPGYSVFIVSLTSTVDPLDSTSTPSSAVANIVSSAWSPNTGFGLDGTTELTGAANTIMLYDGASNVNLSNATLAQAIGNLGTTDPADFLFSASGSDLTLGNATNTNVSFVTTTGTFSGTAYSTSYTINGNIFTSGSASSSSATFNGPVLGGSGVSSQINLDNNLTFNSTVDSAGPTLWSLSTDIGGTLTFNGDIGMNSGTAYPAFSFIVAHSIVFDDSNVILDSGTFSPNTSTTIQSSAITFDGVNGNLTFQGGPLLGATPGATALTFKDDVSLVSGANLGSVSDPFATIDASNASLTLNSGGTTFTSTGAQTYSTINDNGGTYNFDTTAGNITFNANVQGGGFTPANLVFNAGAGYAVHLANGVNLSTAFTSGHPAGTITFNSPLVLDGTSGSTSTFTANGSITLDGVTSTNGANLTLTDSAGEGSTNFVLGGGAITMNGGTLAVNAAAGQTSDTITSPSNAAQTWSINGNSGSLMGGVITFSGMQTMAASNQLNTFDFTGTLTGVAQGGAGTNVFNFSNGTLGTIVGGSGSNTYNFAANQNYSGSITSGSGTNHYIFGNNSTYSGTLTGAGSASTLDFSAYTTPVTINFSSGNSGTTLNNANATIVNFSNFTGATGNETGATAYESVMNFPTSDTANVVQLSLAATNQGVTGTFGNSFTFSGFNTFTGQNSGIDQISFSGFSPTSGATVNGVPLIFTGLSIPTPTPAPTPVATKVQIISAIYPVSTLTLSGGSTVNSSSSSDGSSSGDNNSGGGSSGSSVSIGAITYTSSGQAVYNDPVTTDLTSLQNQQTQLDTSKKPAYAYSCQ